MNCAENEFFRENQSYFLKSAGFLPPYPPAPDQEPADRHYSNSTDTGNHDRDRDAGRIVRTYTDSGTTVVCVAAGVAAKCAESVMVGGDVITRYSRIHYPP